MSRNGKIARLPHEVREELNRRIGDGEEGKQVVKWLNTLPAVQELVQAKFGGEQVLEQNLSQWRKGGYREWLRNQEACELAGQPAELGEYLDETAEGVDVSDPGAGADGGIGAHGQGVAGGNERSQ